MGGSVPQGVLTRVRSAPFPAPCPTLCPRHGGVARGQMPMVSLFVMSINGTKRRFHLISPMSRPVSCNTPSVYVGLHIGVFEYDPCPVTRNCDSYYFPRSSLFSLRRPLACFTS